MTRRNLSSRRKEGPRNRAYHSCFSVVARYWRIKAKFIWILCMVMSCKR